MGWVCVSPGLGGTTAGLGWLAAGFGWLWRLGATAGDGDGNGFRFALGGATPGWGLTLVPGGAGGTPFAPGTGNALAFGSSLIFPGPCGVVVGAMLAGTAGAVVAGLAAGLFAMLGGTGNLPCWISDARCLTEGGRTAVAVGVAGGDAAGAAVPGVGAAGGAGGGWLITVLMTVVLWMLL